MADVAGTRVGPLESVRTARLHLQRVDLRDLPDIERMHADAEVMATLGGVRSAALSRALLEAWIAHWDAHGFGLWIARDRETGAFAGRGGLQHVVVGGRPEVEVAYGFLPAFWGRGFATELAAASLRAGFETLGRADLVCFTLVTNRASQRVMEKVGFGFEREVEHANLPHRLYRLRATEWRNAARD
jgi:[ribosomal protein S5]-alanine N-acetyltransferase